MVTIEILEGKILALDWHDNMIDMALLDKKRVVQGLPFYLAKSQAETLAAVLLVMAKQLD